MSILALETMSILRASGWFPERKTDITSMVDFLKSKGYEIDQSLIDVLSEFGGLKCKFKRPNGNKDSFYINPEEAFGDYYDKEDFDEIEKRVGEGITAIGQARNENTMMFISTSGKIYGETGYCLVKFGEDIYNAMNTLCLVLPGEQLE
ncbi:hypothetical protein BBD42_01015 [Paenibacillus sp. BIHB 4019]|uniref:SUKH-3 domain containing protein n=1 Tax=Paenibacillus sp. BIHB 4019 TaxID=1870819 RepID=A0A1B2DBZ0_9BACL|nr:SUKH-3 domain-containing protein [Paenibacillus sp. BIHB 4019]ANY65215.1 hypothetical protein BBD42_01015 [Paenibacillus sp. BIHB 4019]